MLSTLTVLNTTLTRVSRGSGDPDGVATDPVAGSLGGTRAEICRLLDRAELVLAAR